MNKLPEELIELHNNYLGEYAWKIFVNSLRLSESEVDKLFDSEISEDVAKVLLCKVGPVEHSKRWLETNIPALHNYKPLDVIKNYKEGEEIIRSILMRMP
ncbi:antitoxin Xre/MbcA/ParS toxin-binding domain-containing protein [Vibrio gazogenes]|uniref:Uncharacterized protein n=1 Tax=Vibrio gazogenes TaxID=687 RepID=A0A1Z2SL76_VIBGA|nr:antitoxin Xre/MbcA/ParS toxin-binding domain-containing protein [Vibrio gazogenes]ASA57857.1 hypothetical protein BSQ33_19230 [Vibrio gazogenes]